MKRILLSTFLVAASLSNAVGGSGGKEVLIDSARFVSLSTEDQARVTDLKVRMETLMNTDRSQLDRDDRQALRKEWKALKGEMKEVNRGGTVVYISTAGIIIILLLLIILL